MEAQLTSSAAANAQQAAQVHTLQELVEQQQGAGQQLEARLQKKEAEAGQLAEELQLTQKILQQQETK